MNQPVEETKYDQLFKDLLKAFFGELLQLVAPSLAAQLDTSKPEFLDKEHFTDAPKGKHRYMDLVAKVPTKQPKPGENDTQLVLVHTEIEGHFGEPMDKRMSRYFFQLQHRHDLPVLPLVIFVNGGEPNITTRSHQDVVLGMEVNRFSYLSLGLSLSSAQDYLKKPGALAAALAVHMKRGSLSKAQLTVECMTKISQAKLDDAKQFLAVNFVKSYLPLEPAEQQEYTQLVDKTSLKEVKIMELTWADQIRVEGKTQGKAESLLKVMALRNLKIEQSQKDAVLLCTDVAQLDTWLEKALTATSAEQVFGKSTKAKATKKK
jgi:hypothetical protein